MSEHGSTDPDADLLPAAQAGDPDALDTLLRRHQDHLHAVCHRITGDPTDALDALQEAMILIVRGLPRFDGRSKVSTWMHRVATNACLDELRKHRRRRADPLPEHEEAPVDGRPGVADTVADRTAIDEALASIPEEFRAPLVLRDLLGHDYATIAEILSIPPGTVRSRISRGRATLATRLGGNQDDPADRPTLQP